MTTAPIAPPLAGQGPFCLTAQCPSQAGQVAAIASFLDAHQAYVHEFSVFDDPATARFYVRCVFQAQLPAQGLDALRQAFDAIAGKYDMQVAFHDLKAPVRALILVSKLEHCLADLLFRVRMKELPMDVVGIASNHETLRPQAESAGIPYHYLPVTRDTRPEQEARILQLVQDTGAELVILARYMQILSQDTSDALTGHAINIHHSFLPGFKGAQPYHQAYARGVKVIGATAHFVTQDLDEGPIIAQSVESVDHTQDPARLLATGRHLECQALAHAVRAFVEHRIFLNGQRTIVL